MKPVWGAAALLTVACVAAPPAAADEVERRPLLVVPESGRDVSPMSLQTTGSCTLPATNVVGLVRGPGFPEAGQVVVGNTDVGVSSSAAFSLPLGDTLRSYAAQQQPPAPLKGTYELVLSCREPLGPSLLEYRAELVLPGDGTYTLKPVGAGRPAGSAPGPSAATPGASAPVAAPGAPTPSAAPGTAAPGAGAPSAAGPPPGPSAAAVATPQVQTVASSHRTSRLGLSALLLVLALAFLIALWRPFAGKRHS
ncbi:hypothetical protein [Motilibacter deserti]|uniref:Uncharacterized protein n=1 Tax=Motilibacter deserti TaxID=2714956 RepID=A0ABX0GWE6_9ACTN|nr:hypothetical protein [Motilibacter deserti]NHC14858.1 hypothetical protein [Motilibacter deserti]